MYNITLFLVSSQLLEKKFTHSRQPACRPQRLPLIIKLDGAIHTYILYVLLNRKSCFVCTYVHNDVVLLQDTQLLISTLCSQLASYVYNVACPTDSSKRDFLQSEDEMLSIHNYITISYVHYVIRRCRKCTKKSCLANYSKSQKVAFETQLQEILAQNGGGACIAVHAH